MNDPDAVQIGHGLEDVPRNLNMLRVNPGLQPTNTKIYKYTAFTSAASFSE
jgi:hypothetical protein